jgi:hypothetical protein
MNKESRYKSRIGNKNKMISDKFRILGFLDFRNFRDFWISGFPRFSGFPGFGISGSPGNFLILRGG